MVTQRATGLGAQAIWALPCRLVCGDLKWDGKASQEGDKLKIALGAAEQSNLVQVRLLRKRGISIGIR